ncbi:MAG: MBL fold metallo-hydrolase, partial [Acidimicrobiales bacterium]
HDGTVAVVVDPQRDFDRVLDVAKQAGVEVKAVLETHLHNDYVSGGRPLAASVGALHVVAGAEEVAFPCRAATDGDTLTVGSMSVQMLATPGHTPHHMSYVISDRAGSEALFSGGSLLYGTVGRTDLAGQEATDGLTRAQYRSVRRLVSELPGHTTVHPTHGFGSFCSSASTSGSETSSIAKERETNVASVTGDEDQFVKQLLSGLTAYPRYYAHMGAINRSGPTEADLSPPQPVDPGELRGRIEAGEWVVDLRARRAFAKAHISGSVGVELSNSFATYLGWTIPWGTPLTLVGDTPAQVAEAQRNLVRIGIDRPAGAAVGDVEELAEGQLGHYAVSDFPGLASRMGTGEPPTVLDVRRNDEWEDGHIVGSTHIPLQDLESRLDEVPDTELWVHCAGGFRASIAASLLDRAKRKVVLIDDDWPNAAEVGLPIA